MSTAHSAETLSVPVTPVAMPRCERHSWFTLRRDIPSWGYRTLAISSFLALGALWWWASHHELLNPVFLPTPEAVWDAARTALNDENLWIDLKASFLRVTAGFLLSAAMAIPIGILIGGFRFCEALTQPLTEFVRYIPVPALIPILMVIIARGHRPGIQLPLCARCHFHL